MKVSYLTPNSMPHTKYFSYLKTAGEGRRMRQYPLLPPIWDILILRHICSRLLWLMKCVERKWLCLWQYITQAYAFYKIIKLTGCIIGSIFENRTLYLAKDTSLAP